MNIRDLAHAESILQQYVPNVAKYTGDDMSLKRMWPLLERAGNPHQKLRVIHIAGTSGKTSTAYYIAALLTASGQKTGLTVSPHIDSITERVQIGGEPLDAAVFCQDLGEFFDLIDGIDVQPSYFELLIVFVLWEFVRHQVDYAVVETGLGGLLDGTNVVTRADKVCVITDIGLDHMQVLGNTVVEIAAQKAGIIHENNQVFMLQQPPEVLNIVGDYAEQKQAHLHVLNKENHTLIARNLQLPFFQQRNFSLAEEVVAFVARRDGFQTVEGFDPTKVVVPGRMERIKQADGSTLVLDGAHNGQKMQAFVASFTQAYPDQKATVMLAMKQGKEYQAVIDTLADIADSFIMTTFNTSQDMPIRAQDPNRLRDYASEKGIETVVDQDNKTAYARLQKSTQLLKIITGSLYLLGQTRNHIQNN